ncbi:MAG: hypothetical protein JJU05_09900 [Verrucomicrobia bacterium]|nr:hypothetical protein [Verrucomicrobiota bacterium]MCH8527538.1 glycoside hydrolase family 31 protein [Kiritimatiellia bacterium]
MYYQKFPYPANARFPQTLDTHRSCTLGQRTFTLQTHEYPDDVYRITWTGPGWERNHSRAEFNLGGSPEGTDQTAMRLETDPLSIHWVNKAGDVLLKTAERRAFGVNGDGFAMAFSLNGDESIYGLGEKFLGLELSGRQTKFWNTDVVGDFSQPQLLTGRCDPAYVSIPYVILQRPEGWVGILVNNPGAVYMNMGASLSIEGLMDVREGGERCLLLGAPHGQPDVFFLFADSLASLTRKFQTLVGTMPLPPVWALGYHQCRWGYRSAADLQELKTRFRSENIPVSGLWLDIDYMEGYRVFTMNPGHFPEPVTDLAGVQSEGQKVIPIIDPGVKQEKGYSVYESGMARNAFCLNREQFPFVGLVWPGETLFPDFSQAPVRAWWAEQVKAFAAAGFHGCWNDMNDPSTGYVDSDDMRFQEGTLDHWTFHNQYANGMAEATREGFLAAHPDLRPFVLSRSGYTGIARHAAIWTGDSVSNYHWLRMAIPASLNLSLSGVPMNGPDIGGFCDDTNRMLFIDWLKACFLFPFCRNHTAIHTRPQEPWTFGDDATPVIRHFIQLRYKLRPYLYQLFMEQASSGEAVLRPMIYDFEPGCGQDFRRVEDQFMIGPALMQAPVLTEDPRDRSLLLPPGAWWDFMRGEWIQGSRSLQVAPAEGETPLFARAGYVIPATPGLPEDHRWNGAQPDFHCFLPADTDAETHTVYRNDDGETHAFQTGKRSELHLRARVSQRRLHLDVEILSEGFGAIRPGFVLYDTFEGVTLNGVEMKPEPLEWQCMQTPQRVWRIPPLHGTPEPPSSCSPG